MAKAETIRAKSDDELSGQILELKKEQFNLRFQQATGQLENTARFRQVRRELAQIKTVIKQRADDAKQAGK